MSESAASSPQPASNADGVIFVDDDARALLADQLDALRRPDRHDWQQVKQNVSRTVYRTSIGGQGVYLKHFHPCSLAHRMARAVGGSKARHELASAQFLQAHDIPTTEPLAAECSGAVEWFATREVPASQQGDLWHREQVEAGSPEARSAVAHATEVLAELIARMHNAGLVHRDLHCGNLLVRTDAPQPRLAVMDLHRVHRRRRLSRRARAANLAQLLHDRFDLTSRSQRLRFLRRYLRAGHVAGSLRGWAIQIEEFAQRHTRRQYAARDRRIRKDNKYFRRLRLPGGWRGHVVLASKWKPPDSRAGQVDFTEEQWRALLADPESLFDKSAGEVVKDSASSLVIRRKLMVGQTELDVHVKRASRKKPWKILPDCLRPSRAIRAFCAGHSLLTRGIETALPLVALERRVGPFLVDSVLVTETVHGLECNQFLNHWLAHPVRTGPGLDDTQKRLLAHGVLRELGHVLQRLHDHNYAHRDLKASNMLIRWDGQNAPKVALVDLDGVRGGRRLTMRRRFQGLMRLNVSLLECPAVNHAGRLRMLLGYLRRPGSGRIRFKPYWRALEIWSDHKLRQQIRSRRKQQWAVRRPGA